MKRGLVLMAFLLASSTGSVIAQSTNEATPGVSGTVVVEEQNAEVAEAVVAEATPAESQPAQSADTPTPQAETETNDPNKRPGYKDYREDRPFQVELLMGMSWQYWAPQPHVGVGMGVHLNRNFYVGVKADTSVGADDHDRRDYNEKGYDSYEVFGQDAVDKSDEGSSSRAAFEVRYTPWDFGVYFSAGVLYNTASESTITYKKKTRYIGSNEYKTALKATLKQPTTTRAALGVGYHHTFKMGLTLAAGVLVGPGSRVEPEVAVSAYDSDTTVSQADLDSWKRDIENNESTYPGMFNFSVGYAF